MNNYCWIIIAAILSIIPMVLVKIYVNNGSIDKYLICVAIIVEVLLVFSYVKLASGYTASQAYSIVKILSIIMITIVGFLLLGETIGTRHIIGILFGLVSLYLLATK